MDDTPGLILRLHRLETLAEAYHERALKSGNQRRAARAAKLIEATSSRGMAIALPEVTRYVD